MPADFFSKKKYFFFEKNITVDKPWNDLELSWKDLELSWKDLELSWTPPPKKITRQVLSKGFHIPNVFW